MVSLGLRAWGLWGLAFAVAYQLVAMMHETKPDASVLPEISPETDRNLRAILEGDYSHATEGLFTYNLVDIKGTPTGTGTKLYFLSWLVTKSWLSPILLRHMVNKNGVGFVRKLVSSKEYIQSLPVTHHPVHKATKKDLTIANNWNYKYGGKEMSNTSLTRYESIIFQEYVKKREDPHHQHSNPGYRTVLDYHYVYSAQKATPTQVLDRWIEGATRHVSHLKAFANLDPVLIMEQAKASTDRWKEGRPLSLWDGVPVAIKDQSAIRGLPICFGSSVCTGKHTSDDLPSFFLKTSGAIVVGTTVMTEGGVTPLGYNAHFDGPFNPFDVNYYSGGSSSGSVVAVASGLVPMAVGWDGGGSIRVPAAMSGMVGLAPTFGRVSFRQGSGSTNVKAGPIAATTIDAALGHLVLGQVYKSQPGLEESSKDRVFYNEIFGTEYLPSPHLDDLFLEATEPPLEGVRLGIFWDHFRDTDPEVYQKSLQVVQFLEKDLGATIVNITIPFLKELHLAHGMKILSEFGKTWEASFYEGGKLEANTEISVMLGRTFSACELLAAETLRTFGIRYVREYLFDHHQLDAIVSPALGTKIPSTPPKNSYRRVGESNVPLVYKVMKFVPMVNFLGLPALVVPIGHEETTKLPIGFQFWGDAWSEAKLLKLGGLVEERFWTATHQQRQTPPPENFFDTLEPWLET